MTLLELQEKTWQVEFIWKNKVLEEEKQHNLISSRHCEVELSYLKKNIHYDLLHMLLYISVQH